MGVVWGATRVFLQRVGKLLRNKEMSCRARQKSEGKSTPRRDRSGQERACRLCPPSQRSLGARKSEGKGKSEDENGEGYAPPRGVCISMKRKGLREKAFA